MSERENCKHTGPPSQATKNGEYWWECGTCSIRFVPESDILRAREARKVVERELATSENARIEAEKARDADNEELGARQDALASHVGAEMPEVLRPADLTAALARLSVMTEALRQFADPARWRIALHQAGYLFDGPRPWQTAQAALSFEPVKQKEADTRVYCGWNTQGEACTNAPPCPLHDIPEKRCEHGFRDSEDRDDEHHDAHGTSVAACIAAPLPPEGWKR